MTSRVKEDERIEKIIRGLLKLPENRRCINCNSLGPQYVCTTFLSFICTNCSGVHREFTHRVKSVSMAKFTVEEVSALQAGGNERARQIYFKGWDPQRHSFPDGSNLRRLRDFIKHVYVDRKYTGERSTDQLPKLKLSDKEDSNKKVDMYERRSSERSSSGGGNDDRSFKYSYDERRSPRYAQNNRYGGSKRNPVRFEVVDDRFRDDGFGSGRKSDSRRFSNVESVPGSRSPNGKKNMDRSKSPVVRPVSDILGENVPSLQVGKLTNVKDRKDADGSAPNLKITPTSNVKTADGNPMEHKRVNSGSLIDFNTNPEPPDAAPVPQAQKKPPSIDAGNLAGFGSPAKEKASHPSNENTLESLLSQLIVPPPVPSGDMHEVFSSGSVPSTAPVAVGNVLMLPAGGVPPAACVGGISALSQFGASTTNPSTNLLMPNEEALKDTSTVQPTNVTMPPPGGSAAAAAASATNQSTNFLMEPSNGSAPSAASTANPSSNVPMSPLIGGAPAAATSGIIPSSPNNTLQVTNAQLPSMQKNQPSASSNVDISSSAQQASLLFGALDDQLWASSLASNADGPATASAEQLTQDVSKPAQETSSGGGLQSMEVKSSGRKELPLDLFTASHTAVPAPVPQWQSSQHHVMGFGMQYHPAAMPLPAFPNPTTSTNPFDINSGTVQATMFPSMASMQAATSNVSAPTGSFHTSCSGTQSPKLVLAQSLSYPSTMPPQSPTISPRVYMEQQALSNISPSGIQGFGSYVSGGAEFSSFSTNQHSTGGYTDLTHPNSFSSGGGNPFG